MGICCVKGSGNQDLRDRDTASTAASGNVNSSTELDKKLSAGMGTSSTNR